MTFPHRIGALLIAFSLPVTALELGDVVVLRRRRRLLVTTLETVGQHEVFPRPEHLARGEASFQRQLDVAHAQEAMASGDARSHLINTGVVTAEQVARQR